MSAIKKGKRSVMPRRVSSSCPEPQTDFNKLRTVFGSYNSLQDRDLSYDFKTNLYHEYTEMKLPAQVMGSL